MAKRFQVTFDAQDPHRLARWWAELLDYEVEDSHEFVSGLLDSGVIAESDLVRLDGRLAFADAVATSDPDGGGPRLYFQRVPEEKTVKNRVHLDVPFGPGDLDALVDRLTRGGATFVDFGSHPGVCWAVMQDPEGNEFCAH